MDCGDCAFVNNRLFLVCFIFIVRFVLFLFCLFFNPRNQRPYDPTTKLTLHSFTRQTCSVIYRKFRSWSEIKLKLRNGNRVYVLRKLEKDNFTSWLSRGEEKLTGKSDAYGTCRVVVLLIERIVLLYHVSVPSPLTEQRRLKKVNSRCSNFIAIIPPRNWILKNVGEFSWIYGTVPKSRKRLKRKLLGFFFTSSMKIKIRKFSCSNATKKREARAKRSLFCWSDSLRFCSNIRAARKVFPHWSQKIITNLPIKRSFSYSVISLVFKGFQNIGIYVTTVLSTIRFIFMFLSS